MPDPMTERSEILKQLEGTEFKDRRGRMIVPAVLKEVYVNSVIAQRAVTRCPVTRGEKTFEEVHVSLRNTPPKNPGADMVNVRGKFKARTIILIIIVAALLITGGAEAAMHLMGA